VRQVARRLRDGRLELLEVPEPSAGPGSVAVRVEASVISAGTERATLDVARKNLLAKARARPEQARQVIDRARREGLRATAQLVRRRLEELAPLGYSAAGTVVEAGAEVRGLAPGDRVAIAGGGHATHAELDIVPQLLCARIPEGVESADAAFATVGAIAMQGFRRSGADVGSTVAVIGLGLIGQLAARIAAAAGCRVLAVDLDPAQVELARRAGAEALLREEVGSGWDARADAVLVCASAPGSDDPVRLAAQLARDRAPVVVVGDTKLELPRDPYYHGELDLRLSRSYGPGRYDPGYELHGRDYPIGYVRWTEQRNMESFLWLVAAGKLRPSELVTHRLPFVEAERAFAILTGEERDGEEASLVGILLTYGGAADEPQRRPAPEPGARRARTPVATPRFGMIGAGSFATATLAPGLIEAGVAPGAVASAGGLSAEDARRRFDFEAAYADPAQLLAREDLDLIAIATRHDSHAELAAAALRRGLATYVEKPLALDFEGLAEVLAAQRETGAPLFVGFNRRWAPLAAELRRRLGAPRLMRYRVNAGRLAPDHWTNDPLVGGGRLLGEGCHFVDFLCDQASRDPVRVSASGFRSRPELALLATDNFSLRIEFADGSVGTLDYAADAPTGPGKERFEASAPGMTAVLDDFRRAVIWDERGEHRLGGRRLRKGWSEQYAEIASVLRGEAEPPRPESFAVSSLATLAAARSLGSGRPEAVIEPAEGEDARAPSLTPPAR
jgi:predicted dehydrogenase/threonine dehydrogenase-like Zn-dependent dehydrogenase